MKVSFRSQKQLSPEHEHHVQIDYAASKRKPPRLRWYLILLVVLSPFIYVLLNMGSDLLTITAPGYISYNQTTIRTGHDGFIKAIYVKNGDTVKQNELIAQLRDPNLEQRQLDLKTALTQYSQVNNDQVGNIESELQKKLAIALQSLEFHQAQMAIAQRLRDEQELDINEYATAKQQLLNAELDVQNAKIAIAQLQNDKARNLMTPGSYLNQGDQLQQQKQALLIEEKQLAIQAPVAGKIIDIYSAVGEFLSAGSPILLETTDIQPTISAFLDPKYGQYTNMGQKVIIQFPAGEKIKGVVATPPKLTKRLPEDLASAVGTRKVMIVVDIKPLEAIPHYQDLQGLPVKVNFSLRKAKAAKHDAS